MGTRADSAVGSGRYDLRVDAARLRAPVERDDGTVIYETVIATAGERLDYPWGSEVVDESALSDPEYLEAHEGLSLLIDRHPEGDRVDDGDTKGVRRIGSVLSARWDAASRAAIARIAVHDPKDQALVKQMRAVSEGYSTATKGGRQVKRLPNHIVITGTPRAASAQLRADQKENLLDPKELMAKVEAQAGELAILRAKLETAEARAESATAELERIKASSEESLDEAKADMEGKVAEAEARADSKAVELAAELVSLHSRADSLGVEIPESAKTVADVRAAIAVALGCDADHAKDATRADSWIAASEAARANQPKRQTEAQVFRNSTKRADTADNATSNFSF